MIDARARLFLTIDELEMPFLERLNLIERCLGERNIAPQIKLAGAVKLSEEWCMRGASAKSRSWTRRGRCCTDVTCKPVSPTGELDVLYAGLEEKTVVIIAHRINIVQPCDCIVMTELGGAVGCDSW